VWSLVVIGALGIVAAAPQILHGFARSQGLLTSRLLLDWSPMNALRTPAHLPEGAGAAIPNAFYYLAPLAHPAYLVPPFGLAALLALLRLGRQAPSPPLVLVAGWMLAGYLFLVGMPVQMFRFGLLVHTPAAILAGVGVSLLGERTGWRRPVTILAAACVLATALWAWRMTSTFALGADAP
jgi:hypothetical protein